MQEARFSRPNLCSLFSNFRFGAPETGSIGDRDWFAGPRIGCRAQNDAQVRSVGRIFRTLLQEIDGLLLLGPRIRQGSGEASDREICRRAAIDDRRDDAGRHECEGCQQADMPFALAFAFGAHADKVTVGKIVADNIARESRLHTDESKLYPEVGQLFAAHESVRHTAGEYVRGDVHTNSAEGYFSIFKRGMRGVYQHCSEKHLHRYLAEYDFRYNNRSAKGIEDGERATLAVKNAAGKRLTYRGPDKPKLPH